LPQVALFLPHFQMTKTNLKTTVRNHATERGIGIELFRLDAEAPEAPELTAEEIEALAESEDETKTTAVMRIYEEIGESPWSSSGMTVKKFSEELNSLNGVKRLNVHINSLGGDTFTAQAIYSILSDFDAKKTAYIDGVAASAATIIACAADEVIARENSSWMVHLPWMVAIGNVHTMRKAAEDLEAITAPVVAVYRTKVGGKIDDEKIFKLMEDETWMTAEKALEYGFVDKVRGKIRAISKANKNQILCSGRLLDVAKYGYRNVPNYPEVKLKKKPAAETVAAKEKGRTMTKDDIDAVLLSQIEAEVRTAERARLSALDAMNPRNDPALAEIISKARDEGKHPGDIALACFEVAQKQLASAATINALARDAKAASGVAAGDAPVSKIFTPLSPEEQAQKRFASSLAQAVKATNPPNWRGNGSSDSKVNLNS
jgi:ATP-dependent protease ClpP protease subunit